MSGDTEENLESEDYEFQVRSLKSRLRSTRECLEILRDQYTSAKDEIAVLTKEKQVAGDLVFKLNNENVLVKKEVSNLKLEKKSLTTELDQMKRDLETEKSLKNLKNSDENESSKYLAEIDELKRKNYFLQLENDKAVAYVSDYVNKFKEFEENLIKERARFYNLLTNANKEILDLKNELENTQKQNNDSTNFMELDKIKKENQELNTKCVNLRLSLTRALNSKKEQKEKISELNSELKEKEIEIENLKQSYIELERIMTESESTIEIRAGSKRKAPRIEETP